MITLEQATVGAIVLLKHQQGIIIGASNINPNFVIIEFNNGYCNSYNIDILELFDPVEQEAKRLEEENKALKEEINNRLLSASKLIQEADVLAKAKGTTLTDKKTDPGKYDFNADSLLQTINTVGLADEAKLIGG